MYQTKSTRRLAGKLFGLLGLTAALLMVTPMPVAAAGQVPFRGTYGGSVQFTSPTTVSFDGLGLATHLGRSTNSGVAVITGPDNSTCPGGLANVNTETFTAANGDQLTIQSADVACPVPGPDLAFHGTGHWVVTGGTGRFAGVTGSGSLDGMSDFSTGTFHFTLTGTISHPGGGT